MISLAAARWLRKAGRWECLKQVKLRVEVEMEGARMESEPVLLWLISGGRK